MSKDLTSYNANPYLKRAFVNLQFSNWQVDEIIKCMNDPYYFFENYYYVKTPDGIEMLFNPYKYQRLMLDTMLHERFVICRMARQSGKSTIVIAYMLWNILFHQNRDLAILSKTEKDSIGLLTRIKFAYEKLPKWMQQGITRFDQTKIELENKSSITAAATTSAAARGSSYYCVFLDEFAFVPGNMAEEFYTSVYPTISAGKNTKIFIVSTPNGMNLFYRMFDDAERRKSTFVPITFDWTVVPGRDETWKIREIKNIGQEKFDQEYAVQFLGSVNTLIGSQAMHELKKLQIQPIDKRNGLDIFDYVVPGRKYIITVDTSEGVGKDYSAFSVIDVTEKPYVLVAKYRNNREPILTYPNIILSVARRYNDAYVLIEVNDLGSQIASTMFYQFSYDNLICTNTSTGSKYGQVAVLGNGKNKRLGLKMSQSTKRVGCANIKDIIESGQLIIRDFDYLVELSNFVKTKDSFAAKEGETDDLVMTLVMFGWLAKQDVFSSMTKTDIQRDWKNQKEEIHLPFPIRRDYSELNNRYIDRDGCVWEKIDDYNFGVRR